MHGGWMPFLLADLNTRIDVSAPMAKRAIREPIDDRGHGD